jgi:hypothetical protein
LTGDFFFVSEKTVNFEIFSIPQGSGWSDTKNGTAKLTVPQGIAHFFRW